MTAASLVLKCPKDAARLVVHRGDSLECHTCQRCRGLWFSMEQLLKYTRVNRPAATALPRSSSGAIAAHSQHQWPCPQCRQAHLSTKQVDNVEVDVCPRCRGIWLDAGELEPIREWYLRRTEKRSATNPPGYGPADALLDVIGQADSIVEVIGPATEVAGEGAAAVAEFLGEILASILS